MLKRLITTYNTNRKYLNMYNKTEICIVDTQKMCHIIILEILRTADYELSGSRFYNLFSRSKNTRFCLFVIFF